MTKGLFFQKNLNLIFSSNHHFSKKSSFKKNIYGQISTQIPIKAKPTGLIVFAMRHGIRTKRLGRPADQRKAIIRSLVTQVLTYGTIKTTATRAKYIRKYVDKMITLSKNGSLHSRRQMEAVVFNKTLVNSIMSEPGSAYATRNGGYCRVNVERRVR